MLVDIFDLAVVTDRKCDLRQRFEDKAKLVHPGCQLFLCMLADIDFMPERFLNRFQFLLLFEKPVERFHFQQQNIGVDGLGKVIYAA